MVIRSFKIFTENKKTKWYLFELQLNGATSGRWTQPLPSQCCNSSVLVDIGGLQGSRTAVRTEQRDREGQQPVDRYGGGGGGGGSGGGGVVVGQLGMAISGQISTITMKGGKMYNLNLES